MSSPVPSTQASSFVVLYTWKLHPEKESQFQAAWHHLMHILQARYGALGARLHQADNGTWVAFTQWPDREAWEHARTSPPQSTEVFTLLREAIAMEFPPLLMDLVADLLMCRAHAGTRPHPMPMDLSTDAAG